MGRFEVVRQDGNAVLAVKGPVESCNAPAFRAAAVAVLRRRRLVVDLTACEHIDGRGLDVLWKLSRIYGRRLKIVVARESKLRGLFLVTALCRLLPLASTLEEAIRS